MSRVIFIALCPFILAADWPQFRGPTQQGIAESKNLPTEWDTTKNVAWKTKIPGLGWSSPVISKGMIVITSAIDKDGAIELHALAIKASNGDIAWDQKLNDVTSKLLIKHHPKNSNASPSAIIDGDDVYVHFGHLGTGRLKLSNGEIVWFNKELAYTPVHGNGGSPIIHDGKLIFNIDGSDRQEIVALNTSDGQVAWKTPRKAKPNRPFSFCTCTLAELHGKLQLISAGSDTVMSLDPKTGQELWRFAYTGYSVVPRPIVADGVVYVCTGYDSAKLLAIKPTAEGGVLDKSALLWKAEKNAPLNPSLVHHDGLIYGVSDSGIASCWDAKTGEVYWSERVKDKYSSSILLAPGRLYLQSETGVGTVLKLGKTFESLGTNDLKEKSLASYGVDGDALIIRTESHLYRIENKKVSE